MWLHMHRLSFTSELWDKFLCLWVPSFYAWPYLKRPRQSTTVHIFVPLVSGLLSSVQAQIRIKLPCMLQLQSSLLRVADAALWQSGFNWPSHTSRYRSLWNIWMRSFKIYGKWSVQANKQASKHTHTHAQCSHASVGLTQARPNYWAYTSLEKQILEFFCYPMYMSHWQTEVRPSKWWYNTV